MSEAFGNWRESGIKADQVGSGEKVQLALKKQEFQITLRKMVSESNQAGTLPFTAEFAKKLWGKVSSFETMAQMRLFEQNMKHIPVLAEAAREKGRTLDINEIYRLLDIPFEDKRLEKVSAMPLVPPPSTDQNSASGIRRLGEF